MSAARRRAILLALVSLAVVAAPAVLPLRDPAAPDFTRRSLGLGKAPFLEVDARSGRTVVGPLLGTDEAGRCLLARMAHGTRVSWVVALAGGFVCLVVGASVGLLAGWRGGATDGWVMRIVDAADAAPAVAIVVLVNGALRAAGGPLGSSEGRMVALCVVLGLGTWFFVARMVRAKTAWIRGQGFVEAAIASGVPSTTILRRHVLPNLGPTLRTAARAAIPRLVLFEAFLSFLGLGVEPPRASLGALARAGFDAFSAAAPDGRALFAPCLVLAALTAAFGGARAESHPEKERPAHGGASC